MMVISMKSIINKKQYCVNCEKETDVIALCNCCTKPTRILEVTPITKKTIEEYKNEIIDYFERYGELINNKIGETKEKLEKIRYIMGTCAPKDLDEFNTANDLKIVTERYLEGLQKNKTRIENNKDKWFIDELKLIGYLLKEVN